jgi:GNAT superfamily N-acetyltransferase
MTDLVVRDAQGDDAEALARILCLAHPFGSEYYRQWSSPTRLRQILAARQTTNARGIVLTIRVAEQDGAVVGALLSRLAYDRRGSTDTVFTDIGLVDALAVVSSARRSGAGRALVKDAEKHFRAHGVRVSYAEATAPSVPFYEACGYRVERPETGALTFFPRQGPRLYTHTRDAKQPYGRLVWKSLTGSRATAEPYAHPGDAGQGTAVRGVIPGDVRRTLPWPTLVS